MRLYDAIFKEEHWFWDWKVARQYFIIGAIFYVPAIIIVIWSWL